MGAAPHILIGLEGAPKNRMNAQHRKIIRGDDASRRDLCRVANAERGPHDLAYEKGVKQFAVLLKIHEIRPGETGMAGLSASVSGKSYQPLLMRYCRVWAEQKAFHPTENRGIGADAQGQTKDCQECKAGTAAEHSEGETQVLDNSFEKGQSAGF